MILYHGTYTDFSSIDLEKCRPYKDFGKGLSFTAKKQAVGRLENQ